MRWIIITPEYPPQPGGVSDYTRIFARALCSRGEDVSVWAPAPQGRGPAYSCDDEESPISIHRLAGRYGPISLMRLSQHLKKQSTPYRLLVQYVPHGYGWKAMNIFFALWLALQRHAPMWIVFHEVAFPFRREQPWKLNLLAIVNRLMARLALCGAERIFVTIPEWKALLAKLQWHKREMHLLPVFSNIPTCAEPEQTSYSRTVQWMRLDC